MCLAFNFSFSVPGTIRVLGHPAGELVDVGAGVEGMSNSGEANALTRAFGGGSERQRPPQQNSILLGRTMAFFGELSWVFQTTTALRFIDTQTGGKRWIQASAWGAWVIYFVAECCSEYNTATMNQKWAAIEVFVDGLSYFTMLPSVLYLLRHLPADQGRSSSAKIYLVRRNVECGGDCTRSPLASRP